MKSNLLYHDEHRHATWLELFFDLVFVALIGKVTHLLAHTHHGHLDFDSALKFVLLFLPLWWIWANHTVYNNIYDKDSKEQRIVTLIIMFLMIILSIFTKPDFNEVSFGYLAVFNSIRVILGISYLHFASEHRECRRYSLARGKIYFVAAAIGSTGLLFKGESLAYIIGYTSIVIEFFLLFRLEHREHNVLPHIEHLVERTGLLTIIVLGETLIGLVSTLGDIVWTPSHIVSLISGVLLIGSIWWIYFDSFHYLEKTKTVTKAYVIMVPNMFLCLGLAVMANVIRHAVSETMVIEEFKWMVFIGILLFYIGKQIPYAVAFKNVRRSLLINTLIVLGLSGVNFMFSQVYQIMVFTTLSLFVYIYLNFRNVLKEHLLTD